eukprot:scaffold3763_cov165-Amphora_coffeaeformis.AAC.14
MHAKHLLKVQLNYTKSQKVNNKPPTITTSRQPNPLLFYPPSFHPPPMPSLSHPHQRKKKREDGVISFDAATNRMTRMKTNRKKHPKTKELLLRLRQQAKATNKKTSTKRSSRVQGDAARDKTDKEEEATLWGKVTNYWRTKGNATEVADNDNVNSTNPLSVVQKYWQDTLNRREEEWIDVIPKTRLSPGEVVPVTVGGLDLLIIAGLTSDTRLYAIANSCPHLGTPLEIGQLVRLPKESPATATTAASDVVTTKEEESANRWTELQVSSLLQQDGCEDCIVCPLHRTAFALESGQVRGEWCPYPPVVGKLTSLVKDPTPVATFDVRVRKKNIQVRLNSPLPPETKDKKKD